MVPIIPLLPLLLLLLLTPHSWATTYYVDPAGSNSNPGTDEALPFLTVKKCVDLLLSPGDTCYVRNGTYTQTGTLRIAHGGTQSAPVQLLAYPGHAPVIEWPLLDEASYNAGGSIYQLEILQGTGYGVPISYVVIDGLTFRHGYLGIHAYQCTQCTISHNKFDDPFGSCILFWGSLDTIISKNLCMDAGFVDSTGRPTAHGFYIQGSRLTVANNLIIGATAFGMQINGAQAFDATKYPSADYSNTADLIIHGNTIAYGKYYSAITVWGGTVDNARIENNIFYENAQGNSTYCNGIDWTSATGSTGILIRNNLRFASGSGGTCWVETGGPTYTDSGNVSADPLFVAGGSNALPVSWDFSLTSASPAIGMARTNEFANNPTLAVGAFATVGTPTASITQNTMTVTFPMNTDTPIQVPSTTGSTVSCTVNPTACPASPTITSVARKSGTDTQIDITISGIASNACATGQDWKVSYNASTGAWSGYTNIGPYPGLHQKIFSFTAVLATNQCTGSGPSGYPAGYQVYYKFNEGSGTNANDESANNLDGTLTNGPTWGTGKTGASVVVAAESAQYVAIPWGSGVNPSTQSLTIAVGVFIQPGAESATHYVLGPDHGTNQRAYICGQNGTWKLSMQATTCASVAASNLPVTSGWNHLCWRLDSGTDTATLYKDGDAGNGGATRAYTSYTFATNWTLGKVATLTSTGGFYDDLLIYQSLQDCSAIFTAFQATPSAGLGTLTQEAIQFQAVYLPSPGGSPNNFGALNADKHVIAGGAVAIVFQIHCENVTDCDATAFKLTYKRNGSTTRTQVPNTETSDGIWMWGTDSNPKLNSGVTTTRLTGTCAVTTGATVLTASQVPNVDLPQDGCVMLRYVVRVRHVDDVFALGLQTENGLDLPGGYDVEALITVIEPQAQVGP